MSGKIVYPVLKAVAYHPTMMFVPAEVAGLNIAANMFAGVVAAVLFNVSLLPFGITCVIGHLFLAYLYTKDSHMVTLAKAVGGSRKRTRNLVPADGVKYVP